MIIKKSSIVNRQSKIRELRLTPQAAFVQPCWRDRFRDWREKHRFKLIIGAAIISAIAWTVAYA